LNGSIPWLTTAPSHLFGARDEGPADEGRIGRRSCVWRSRWRLIRLQCPASRRGRATRGLAAGLMPDLVIRPAVQEDIEVLWGFLAMAAYEADAEAAKAVPSVAKYLVGWPRPGDFGFIAERNGEIIGAAWARRFSAEELRFPYGEE